MASDSAEPVEPRLYIFPHTGGSAEFYVPFARAFTGGTKCVAVQYPGKRAGKDTPGGGVAFFGHSMGALLAFEVALRFEQAGNPIAALFVSAAAAPGLLRRIANLQGSDAHLLGMISTVTGANPEFLNDEQFAATLLPTLRGLKAVTGYESPPEAKVSCPIHAMMADSDELGTEELMSPWQQRTTATFDLTVFSGGHFYINDNLPQLAHWMEERVLEGCARRRQGRS